MCMKYIMWIIPYYMYGIVQLWVYFSVNVYKYGIGSEGIYGYIGTCVFVSW